MATISATLEIFQLGTEITLASRFGFNFWQHLEMESIVECGMEWEVWGPPCRVMLSSVLSAGGKGPG